MFIVGILMRWDEQTALFTACLRDVTIRVITVSSFLSDYTLSVVTKASEECDRIPNECKETEMFLRREIRGLGGNNIKKKTVLYTHQKLIDC
jgi:hypothetical protein